MVRCRRASRANSGWWCIPTARAKKSRSRWTRRRATCRASTSTGRCRRTGCSPANANAIIQGAKGDSLQVFDGRDLSAKPRISVLLSNGKMVSDAGTTKILTLPIRDFAVPNVVASLEQRGPRVNPIDIEKVWGPHEELED